MRRARGSIHSQGVMAKSRRRLIVSAIPLHMVSNPINVIKIIVISIGIFSILLNKICCVVHVWIKIFIESITARVSM